MEDLILVKGVNKTVIEVMNTENRYFERILFIVSSDASGISEKKLKKEAQNILNKYEITKSDNLPLRQLYNKRQELKLKIISLSCAALIIAILVTVGAFL